MQLVLRAAQLLAQLLVLALALLSPLLHIEDADHAGKVDALVRKLVDKLQALDIALRVQAGVAARALGIDQALGLVDAQGLRVHARELSGHTDHIQRLVASILGHC